mmetsp:Transcript_50865/g.163522  ORF Transcript_50865/g.163522 Transcript_50865/m.163522 type:complete len:183 (+) Transcript_50865:578-1126(+)
MAGLNDAPLADPVVVFAMMFGERKFGHLVGDLAVVTQQRLQDEGLTKEATAEKLKAAQDARENRLAKLLATRLDEWVSGDKEKFVREALVEVAELHELHMGPQMLASIGIEYELSADRALGVKGHDWFGHAALSHQFASASRRCARRSRWQRTPPSSTSSTTSRRRRSRRSSPRRCRTRSTT